MRSLFTRLLTGGAAYQASSVAAAVLALVTLPLYTHALTKADFGIAETLLTFIILASILLRFGLGEAFVRFYHATAEGNDRDRLSATTVATVLLDLDRRRAARARSRQARSAGCSSASRTRASCASASSACGPSRTSRSPTRCCASRSAGART